MQLYNVVKSLTRVPTQRFFIKLGEVFLVPKILLNLNMNVQFNRKHGIKQENKGVLISAISV